MRLKLNKKRAIPFTVGLIFLLGSILYLSYKNPIHSVNNVFAVRLEIPIIHVDVPIESVGITQDGAMDVPKDADNVGWYSRGPQPGEKGSAVIAGHKGWKNDKPAVFDNLNKLEKGDKISILNSDGSRIFFIVRDIRLYDQDAIVPEIFVTNVGSHLNLITCVGIWNEDTKSYSERWVVFADLME